TSPFKKAAARATGSALEAVNTLVRREGGYASFNTDGDGAAAVLRALAARHVVVLGDGGAAVALRGAAQAQGLRLEVCRRADVEAGAALPSAPGWAAVWTWPPRVDPPTTLRFP